MALSPREQRILDSIATELEEENAALAATLAEPRLRQRSPLPRSHAGVLVFALLTLITLHPLAITLGLVGLAILTGALKPRGHGLADPDAVTTENKDRQTR